MQFGSGYNYPEPSNQRVQVPKERENLAHAIWFSKTDLVPVSQIDGTRHQTGHNGLRRLDLSILRTAVVSQVPSMGPD